MGLTTTQCGLDDTVRYRPVQSMLDQMRVYYLYGLTHVEVRLVDPAFGLSEDRYE